MKQTNQGHKYGNKFSQKIVQNPYNINPQIVVKKIQKPIPLQFSKIQSKIRKTIQEVIDHKLQKRNTILLAKLAKQNFVIISNSQNNSTKDNSQYNKLLTKWQDPLIFKSFDQINNIFCTQISSQLIGKVTKFLKHQMITAKVIANVIIIENSKHKFNLGGVCFWNNTCDGQITIKKCIPPIQQINYKQNHSQKSQSSTDSQSNPFNREGLLIVTIYLCNYESTFKSK